MLLNTRRIAVTLLGLAAVHMLSSARAQDYPNRPIKLIMPFGAGSASDSIARIVSDALGQRLGQRIVVENQAGAGGNVGTNAVARSAPDGYTLVFAAPGPFVINKASGTLPYDPQKDFALISTVAKLVNVLVVNPTAIPVSSVAEFISHVKARPEEISYSSVGLGSSQHLAGAYFDMVAGTRMIHIPYRSGSQIALDLVSGTVPVSFQLIPNVIAQLQAGQVKALAVTASTRSRALPDVPSMAEQGLTNYESYAWFGFAAPRATPAPIIERLHRELAMTMANPAVQKRLLDIGVEPDSSTPQAFDQFLAAEIAKWTEVIQKGNIKLN